MKKLTAIITLLTSLTLTSAADSGELKVGDQMPNITGTLCKEFSLGKGAMCVKEYCENGKIVRIEYYDHKKKLKRVSVFAKDRTQYSDDNLDGIIDFTY